MQVNLNINNMQAYYTASLLQHRTINSYSNLINGSWQKAGDSFGLTDAMRAKIHEITTIAKRNIRLLQITDNGLAKADACLQSMEELTAKATDETLTDKDRLVIQQEINLLRAEMDRNALETENKIRGYLGLPPARGHFLKIDPTDVGAVAVDFQQDEFNKGYFKYDEDSDSQFSEYIVDMKRKAEQDNSPLGIKSVKTLEKIRTALHAMRPEELGVDKLDVTSVEKARASLKKVIKARETVNKQREIINCDIKNWAYIIETAHFGQDYTGLIKHMQSNDPWSVALDVTA